MTVPSLDVASAVGISDNGRVPLVSFRITDADPHGIVNLDFETCEELITSIREAMAGAKEMALCVGETQ